MRASFKIKAKKKKKLIKKMGRYIKKKEKEKRAYGYFFFSFETNCKISRIKCSANSVASDRNKNILKQQQL